MYSLSPLAAPSLPSDAALVSPIAAGLVGLRIAGTRGALVEVNSETDFVARNAKFQEFVEKALEVVLESEGADGDEGPSASATRELEVSELLKAKQSGALQTRRSLPPSGS